MTFRRRQLKKQYFIVFQALVDSVRHTPKNGQRPLAYQVDHVSSYGIQTLSDDETGDDEDHWKLAYAPYDVHILT